MAMTDNLRDIIDRQKEVLSALEAEHHTLENSELLKENTRLKSELEKLRTDFHKSSDSLSALTDENASLKNALYEQIYNEKAKIVNTTAQRLETFFRSTVDGETNRLTAFENSVTERITGMREALVRNNIGMSDEIYSKLHDVSVMLETKVAQARQTQLSEAFSQRQYDQLEALRAEPVTGAQVVEATKKNNLESFVGLKVLNVVGIFLLVIGSITLAKGIAMFLIGGVMLAAGEFMNRKKTSIFSLGMTAGGIGVLYAALATSYFNLGMMGAVAATLVCALIAAGAFVLSTRYNSQIIAIFALIGGYFPMFTTFSDGSGIATTYSTMLYFLGLNLLALFISFSKKWYVATFLGLFLNLYGTMSLLSSFIYRYEPTSIPEKVTAIIYVFLAFFIYMAIPIIGTFRAKARFSTLDVVLLAINTFCSSLIIYWVFYSFGWEDYHGLLAIGSAAIYLLLGKLIESKFSKEETYARELFYLTGLAFVILIIPLQFGRAWLSLGWLAEGVLLAAYGILRNRKGFKQKGFVICLLCLVAFVIYDCMYWWRDLFYWKYLAITVGSLVILGAYMYKKLMVTKLPTIYKYPVLINLWIFTIYSLNELWGNVLFKDLRSHPVWYGDYLLSAAMISATFLIAYAISRIKHFCDDKLRILSIVIYSAGILCTIVLNSASSPVRGMYLRMDTPDLSVTIAGTAVLAALSLLSVLVVRDMAKIFVSDQKLGIEWYPLIISGYFVVLLTQNLIAQYNLEFSSAVISIIYVVTALAWIIFGFARRYSFIRRFGLGLSILAVVKLFIIDLATLTQNYRIVSYFALGAALIAISFVYQFFSKRLELKGVIVSDVAKENKEDN